MPWQIIANNTNRNSSFDLKTDTLSVFNAIRVKRSDSANYIFEIETSNPEVISACRLEGFSEEYLEKTTASSAFEFDNEAKEFEDKILVFHKSSLHDFKIGTQIIGIIRKFDPAFDSILENLYAAIGVNSSLPQIQMANLKFLIKNERYEDALSLAKKCEEGKEYNVVLELIYLLRHRRDAQIKNGSNISVTRELVCKAYRIISRDNESFERMNRELLQFLETLEENEFDIDLLEWKFRAAISSGELENAFKLYQQLVGASSNEPLPEIKAVTEKEVDNLIWAAKQLRDYRESTFGKTPKNEKRSSYVSTKHDLKQEAGSEKIDWDIITLKNNDLYDFSTISTSTDYELVSQSGYIHKIKISRENTRNGSSKIIIHASHSKMISALRLHGLSEEGLYYDPDLRSTLNIFFVMCKSDLEIGELFLLIRTIDESFNLIFERAMGLFANNISFPKLIMGNLKRLVEGGDFEWAMKLADKHRSSSHQVDLQLIYMLESIRHQQITNNEKVTVSLDMIFRAYTSLSRSNPSFIEMQKRFLKFLLTDEMNQNKQSNLELKFRTAMLVRDKLALGLLRELMGASISDPLPVITDNSENTINNLLWMAKEMRRLRQMPKVSVTEFSLVSAKPAPANDQGSKEELKRGCN